MKFTVIFFHKIFSYLHFIVIWTEEKLVMCSLKDGCNQGINPVRLTSLNTIQCVLVRTNVLVLSPDYQDFEVQLKKYIYMQNYWVTSCFFRFC